MGKRALIVHGGWDGHHPVAVADLFRRVLTEDGFDVDVADTLDAFADPARMAGVDLIVPHWTMGQITAGQIGPVLAAVKAGVGLAGCHGGMCDAFRENSDWQFMSGGQWVAHPGDAAVEYAVHLGPAAGEITAGLADFSVRTEQYYLHVDPAVRVLATTRFPTADGPHVPNGTVDMPVVWTKFFGRGKVFYNSLGHDPSVLASEPCLTIMRRGFRWAAR